MQLLSPIDSWHRSAGAKMADFGGWDMPIEYPSISDPTLFRADQSSNINFPIAGGVVAEHKAVRSKVGLFDVSHLGKIEMRLHHKVSSEVPAGSASSSEECGDANCALLTELANQIFTNNLKLIGDQKAQYNLILNDQGGVIDDLIIYRINAHHFFLIPNASNCSAVYDRIQSALSQVEILALPASIAAKSGEAKIELTNLHKDFAVFAIQGPLAGEVVGEFLSGKLNAKWQDLEYMSFLQILPTNAGPLGKSGEDDLGRVIICRTGYTGEFGFEVLVERAHALSVWQELATLTIKNEGRIVGLGARDTLRTEMGYPLHGHEINEEISPLEGGASWAVKFDKGDFLGSNALTEEKSAGVKRRLTALEFPGRVIARAGMEVKNPNDPSETIGIVTSGTFSPSLGVGISLALINRSYLTALQGTEDPMVSVDIRGRIENAKIVKLPFVESHVK